MRYRLVDTPGLGGQKLHEDWHRHLVHGNGHGIRSFPWGKNRCRTLADVHDANLRAHSSTSRPSFFSPSRRRWWRFQSRSKSELAYKTLLSPTITKSAEITH